MKHRRAVALERAWNEVLWKGGSNLLITLILVHAWNTYLVPVMQVDRLNWALTYLCAMGYALLSVIFKYRAGGYDNDETPE